MHCKFVKKHKKNCQTELKKSKVYLILLTNCKKN